MFLACRDRAACREVEQNDAEEAKRETIHFDAALYRELTPPNRRYMWSGAPWRVTQHFSLFARLPPVREYGE